MVRASSVPGSEMSFTRRLRRGIRVRAEHVLDRFGLVEPRPEAASSDAGWAEPAAAVPAPVPRASPVAAEPVPSEPATPGAMTFESVQEIFDDMVRPALQSDGGDITLREVVGGEVRVTLVGACSTCPSSIVTMKMGIERLLEEEFADFEALVQVDG